MIQLRILSGKMAGARCVARHFPLRIGRAPDCGLRLEEPGVWDAHAEISLNRGDGYHVSALGEALLSVNAAPTHTTRLRPGDVLELGGARLQFWLGEPVQRRLGVREFCTWSLIGAAVLGQIGLIYLLL